MLNYVGQTALAASSLAGQVQFLLTMFFIGLGSGLAMLTAQYWGKKDCASIETLTGIAFRLSSAVGFAFTIAACFFPNFLMRIFTNEISLITEGASYLRIVGISYIFMSFSQVFHAVFKSIERVKTVTAITFVTLLMNVFLNATFIFGFFSFPKLGIRGVAIATLISRVTEFFVCCIISSRIKEIHFSPKIFFRKNAVLLRDFLHYSLPAIGNEFVWGAASAMYSVIFGHLGSDIVAANSIVGTVLQLASVLCFGMAYGGAILLGKEMGAGNMAQAKTDSARLWKSTTVAGLISALVICAMQPIVPHFVRLTPQAMDYLSVMMFITAANIFGASVNTVFICGLFRAGGDARFGLITDAIFMWGVSIPLALFAFLVLKLSPLWVFFVIRMDEFEKMPFIIHHYKKGTWLKNITRDF